MGQAQNNTIHGDAKLEILATENWEHSERYDGKLYSELSAADQLAIDQAYDALQFPTANTSEVGVQSGPDETLSETQVDQKLNEVTEQLSGQDELPLND